MQSQYYYPLKMNCTTSKININIRKPSLKLKYTKNLKTREKIKIQPKQTNKNSTILDRKTNELILTQNETTLIKKIAVL